MLAGDAVDRSCDAVRVIDVDLDSACLDILAAEGADRLAGPLLVACSDDDGHAGLTEESRGGESQSAVSTGDQGHLGGGLGCLNCGRCHETSLTSTATQFWQVSDVALPDLPEPNLRLPPVEPAFAEFARAGSVGGTAWSFRRGPGPGRCERAATDQTSPAMERTAVRRAWLTPAADPAECPAWLRRSPRGTPVRPLGRTRSSYRIALPGYQGVEQGLVPGGDDVSSPVVIGSPHFARDGHRSRSGTRARSGSPFCDGEERHGVGRRRWRARRGCRPAAWPQPAGASRANAFGVMPAATPARDRPRSATAIERSRMAKMLLCSAQSAWIGSEVGPVQVCGDGERLLSSHDEGEQGHDAGGTDYSGHGPAGSSGGEQASGGAAEEDGHAEAAHDVGRCEDEHDRSVPGVVRRAPSSPLAPLPGAEAPRMRFWAITVKAKVSAPQPAARVPMSPVADRPCCWVSALDLGRRGVWSPTWWSFLQTDLNTYQVT